MIGLRRFKDLFNNAEQCSRVYQDLKEAASARVASEQYREGRHVLLTPKQYYASTPVARGVSATLRITSFSKSTLKSINYLSSTEMSYLKKEGRCFICKNTGHIAAACTGDSKPISAKAEVANVVVKDSSSDSLHWVLKSRLRILRKQNVRA